MSPLPAPRVGLPEPLVPEVIDAVLRPALEEDRGPGDLSGTHAVPAGSRARARLVAKAAGRIAGLDVFARAFTLCDPRAQVELSVIDGASVAPGDEFARVEGDARALLVAERTALNFLQRLSGIATRTARLVELAGGRARILDTRKTTPLLRKLERYAVRCGGGENHRFGLFDEVMLKENHIDLAGKPLPDVLAEVRARVGAEVRITCEARDEAEAEAAVRGGADVVMLDNFTPERMAAAVPRLRALADELDHPLELEASGGISEATLDAVASSGVDRISVGGLTHSVQLLDLSLYLEPLT
ncbi:MAG: carboxylating nicotinate-nucleotide diphosphorylase [Planctomycetes bacterium]|nr:carboxylating nicotinate-nucleotide diphosphorylase [Planctomycetota bacterium]MCB9904463.1 carboxylating nicotinate-nucleotide diphosphorylase [Planctomycetota bacterium]